MNRVCQAVVNASSMFSDLWTELQLFMLRFHVDFYIFLSSNGSKTVVAASQLSKGWLKKEIKEN